MKDLIVHIEDLLCEKYPLPARAYSAFLCWLPTDTGRFGIYLSDGQLVSRLTMEEQYCVLSSTGLELLERVIAEAQTEYIRKEEELRSILKQEITRLSK